MSNFTSKSDADLKDLSDSINEIYKSYSNSNPEEFEPTTKRYFKIVAPVQQNLHSSEESILESENIDNNRRADTLDSNIDYPNSSDKIFNASKLPNTHIASHLSSNNTDSNVRSLPQTPLSEGHTNYVPQTQKALTNSSLLLIDDDQNNDLVLPNPRNPEDSKWIEDGAAKIIKTDTDSEGNSKIQIVRRTVTDFDFGATLGDGSYSTVVLATDKHTKKKYAIKVLDKRHIIKEKKVKYVNIEKNSLNRLGKRNGIIHLFFTFQDKQSLYFVLDYAPNGELLALIKKYNTLNEECVKYYGAQLLDAIKFMHDNGIVHRDIKPENILIDEKFRIQITDFGTAKLLDKLDDGDYPRDVKATSFVGTAEYVSPELLDRKYCGKASDIWAYGCIIYQMIAGKPPFKAPNEYLTFQKISKLQYAFSAGFPMTIRDLIKQILVTDPKRRASIIKIQSHFFYQSVNWDDHDSIWEAKPPELGPYKMNAKAMMKAPELSKRAISSPSIASSQQSKLRATNTKRMTTNPNNSSPNLDSNPSTPASESPASSRVPSSGSIKPFNAATAAAFALSRNPADIITENNIKREKEKEREREKLEAENNDSGAASISPNQIVSTPKSAKRPKTPRSADVISGTKISRPVVTPSPTIPSSRSSDFVKYKAVNVPTMSTLDLAWSRFLIHPDERVLKLGKLLVSKTLTESFEKKYKGLISDAPLGFNFSSGRVVKQSSLLSQAASGKSGLRRNGVLGSSSDNSDDKIQEQDAIKVFEQEEDTTKKEESDQPATTSEKFKKFFVSNSYNNSHYNNNNNSNNVNEIQKERTTIITTFGRVLLMEKRGDEFGVAIEINTSYPFVKFKEVVSDKRGNGKLIPSTGIFAIESSYTSFVFEVERPELNKWIDSLAHSKLSEIERRAKLAVADESDFNLSSGSTLSAFEYKSSGLLESPSLTSAYQRHDDYTGGSKNSVGSSHSPVIQSSPILNEKKNRESLLMSRLRPKSISAKAKAVKSTPNSATSTKSTVKSVLGINGLPTSNGDLVAAKLAVNNGTKPMTDNKRSSFTKKDNSRSSYPGSPKTSAPKVVTSLNSKLLSRSRNK